MCKSQGLGMSTYIPPDSVPLFSIAVALPQFLRPLFVLRRCLPSARVTEHCVHVQGQQLAEFRQQRRN